MSRYATPSESEAARRRRYKVSVNGMEFPSARQAFDKLEIKCKPFSHIKFRADAIANSKGSRDPFNSAFVDEDGVTYIFIFQMK